MMTLFRVAAVLVLTVCASPAFGDEGAAAPAGLLAQAQPPEQQEEFIPVDELPPQDQLPAAPLLIGAYAFVMVMLFGYLVSVSRRLSAIQQEVDRLDSELKRSGKG